MGGERGVHQGCGAGKRQRRAHGGGERRGGVGARPSSPLPLASSARSPGPRPARGPAKGVPHPPSGVGGQEPARGRRGAGRATFGSARPPLSPRRRAPYAFEQRRRRPAGPGPGATAPPTRVWARLDRPPQVGGGRREEVAWPGRRRSGRAPPSAVRDRLRRLPPPSPRPAAAGPAVPNPSPPLLTWPGPWTRAAGRPGQPAYSIRRRAWFFFRGGGGGVGGRGTRTKKCHFSGACLLLSPARRPLSKKTIPGTHTARPLLHTLTHTARPPPPQHTRQPPPTPHDTHTHTPLKIVGLGPFKANKGEGGNTPFHLLPSSTHAAAASPFFHSSFSHHKSIRASASSRCCPTRTARRPHRVRSGATRASTAWMGE